MQVDIRDRPSFAHLVVRLEPGDRIVAEADAMASRSASITMDTRWNGGFFPALARRYLGGESLFVNEFSTTTGGELVLTQPLPGDIECIELQGNTMYLQPGAFLACESTVEIGIGYAGFASLIGGEGLFRMKVSGRGKVWFGGYGGIFSREVKQEYIVDTGHLIAYEPTIGIKVGLPGGVFSSFFGGEGIVMRLSGPGKVFMQSRSFDSWAAWTNSYL